MTDFSRKDGRIAESRGYRDFVSSVITVPGTPAVTEIPGDPIPFDQAFLEGLDAGEQTVLETFVSTDPSFSEIRKDINYRKVPACCISERNNFGPDAFYAGTFPQNNTQFGHGGNPTRVSSGLRFLKPDGGTEYILASNDLQPTRDRLICVDVPWFCPTGVDPYSVPLPMFDYNGYGLAVTGSHYIRLLDDPTSFLRTIQSQDAVAAGALSEVKMQRVTTPSYKEGSLTDLPLTTGWNFIPFVICMQTDNPNQAGINFIIENLHTSLPLGYEMIVRELGTIAEVVTIDTSGLLLEEGLGVDTLVDSISSDLTPNQFLTTHTIPQYVDLGTTNIVSADNRYHRIPKAVWQDNLDTGLPIVCLDPYDRLSTGDDILGPQSPNWGSGAFFTQGTYSTFKPGVVRFGSAQWNRNSEYAFIKSFRALVLMNKL